MKQINKTLLYLLNEKLEFILSSEIKCEIRAFLYKLLGGVNWTEQFRMKRYYPPCNSFNIFVDGM